MTIRLAESAGFCFGVNRAVNLVYDLIPTGGCIKTLGPIIHNPQVVEDLAQKGVEILDSPEQAKAGDKVVIRSHGVDAATEEVLRPGGGWWTPPAPSWRKFTVSSAPHPKRAKPCSLQGTRTIPKSRALWGTAKGNVMWPNPPRNWKRF